MGSAEVGEVDDAEVLLNWFMGSTAMPSVGTRLPPR
jgi:hypothetical protein